MLKDKYQACSRPGTYLTFVLYTSSPLFMSTTATTENRQLSISLSQLLGIATGILIPCLAVCFVLYGRIVTLENTAKTQADAATHQTVQLGQIQETLTVVRLQLAAYLPRTAPTSAPAVN